MHFWATIQTSEKGQGASGWHLACSSSVREQNSPGRGSVRLWKKPWVQEQVWLSKWTASTTAGSEGISHILSTVPRPEVEGITL